MANQVRNEATVSLAVCAEMIFRDYTIEERIRRLRDLGFEVEIWNWTHYDIDALSRLGATWSSMTGYVHGNLVDDDGGRALVRTARDAIAVAQQLGCPRLVLHGTELNSAGLPVAPVATVTGAMWLTAYRTLSTLADLAESNGVTFCLENLNTTVDHPGVPFGRAQDTLTLVESVNRPGVRLMLDLYHAAKRRGKSHHVASESCTPTRRDPGRGCTWAL